MRVPVAFYVFIFCGLIYTATAHNTKKQLGQADDKIHVGWHFPWAGFDCDACRGLVDFLSEFLKPGADEKFTLEFLTEYCKLQSNFDTAVCTGIIHEFLPEITTIVQKHPNPEYCCWQLGICTNSSKATPPSGIVPFAFAPPQPMRPYASASTPQRNREALNNARAGTDANTGLMLHLADIHLDLLYVVGSQQSCDEPLCCRTGVGQGDDAAGVWGSFPCDTTALMLDAALQEIATQFPNLDYIIWTGDAPPHDVWNQSQAYNNFASGYIAERVAKFMPNVRVLFCLGNHESFPVDQDNDNPNITQAVASAWSQWLPADQYDTFVAGGYYSYVLTPGLRIISLDGTYGIFDNFWTLLAYNNASYQDIGNQLHWLNSTLAAAAAANEVVWLIAHPPFGDSNLNDPYSLLFYQIVAQYPGLIKGQFHGHTHYDSFRVYADAQGNPFLTEFIAPSLTPFTGDVGNHPVFRVYAYDRTSFEVVDWVQYYTNLTEANANPTATPKWQVLYQMLEEYDLPALDPASMQSFARRLWNDTAAWVDFCTNYYSGHPPPGRCTDANSVRMLACDFETKSGAEYDACILAHQPHSK